jgi:glycosyltransferase involved in cell wall biosynthesis
MGPHNDIHEPTTPTATDREHRADERTEGRAPTVSVVVLNKDEPELDATLTLLRQECAANDAECLVVDASEGRLDWIRQNHPWVRWMDYQRPLGLASSIPQQRNTGVRNANGRIIAFCDAGGEPTPGWLRTLTAPIIDGRETVTCGPVRSTRPGVYRVINDLADGTVVERVLTANLAFTRDAFDKIGGFDERYAYGSDMDFAWRLIRAGENPISVHDALMGMDWGAWSLQRKRSWRYGRARGRLLRFHPERRRKTLLEGPEIIVYPLMVLGGLGAIALAALGSGRLRWTALAGWTALAAALRGRQRHEEKPWSVMLSHVIYSTATITELLAAAVGRAPLIGHTPKDPGPYQDRLLEGLADSGVTSGYITGPTRSATVNTFLLPLRAVAGRIRGRRLHHIHWAHEYSLVWTKHRLTRRLMRALFELHLKTLQAVGTKIVWTAHNIVPHEQIFDDDLAARRTLVQHADAVIAHNEDAATQIRRTFGAENVVVIPQGAYPLPAADREQARAALGVGPDRRVVAAVGRINTYKGTEELLEAAAGFAGTEITVVVAGAPADEEIRDRISALAESARQAGADVRTDLRHCSDEELAEVLAAADLVVFPFRSITNSGSVVLALSADRPALVRDLPALRDLPEDAVLRYQGGAAELGAAILAAVRVDEATTATRRDAARRWTNGRSWAATGAATRRVYEDVLAGKLKRRIPQHPRREIVA